MENNNFIILDIGSGYCKAGFSGEIEPKIITPTIIGHQKSIESENIDDNTSLIFSENALEKSNILNIEHPIKKGSIKNWNDLNLFLDNLFKNELKIDCKNYGILITETSSTSKLEREKLVELLFDNYQFSQIYINNGAILSLYGACKFSGFVLDSGFDYSEIVPIRNGFPFKNCIKKINIGGNDINEYLKKLLIKNNNNNNISLNEIDINNIKEKYCFIAENNTNIEKEKNHNEIIYELPDKSKIKIKDEIFLAPELNFHPEMIEKEFGGLAQIFCSCMYDVDNYTKQKFDGTLVLSGGNTLFQNFTERLSKEIKNYYGGKFKDRFEIVEIPERKFIQWIGGSIFSIMSIFNGLCTTKQEYNENGAKIIHKKCFY